MFLCFQFCFEFNDPIDIATMVTNKANYYNHVAPLPNWNKPDLDTNVPSLSITLDQEKNLKKYEFQIGTSKEYVPKPFFPLSNAR